eukprot:jgi/Mesvir1/18533/Mv26225-RA.1
MSGGLTASTGPSASAPPAPAPAFGGSGYPMHTAVGTPTGRSMQVQERINDLATKIFTGYELQSIRTYMPSMSFKIEEAPMITHNILDTDPTLITKLREFLASVYLYDILSNLMRDFHERVSNATRFENDSADTNKLGQVANALRGFKAIDLGTKTVYLGRIPTQLLANVTSKGTIKVPSLGLNPDPLDSTDVQIDKLDVTRTSIDLPGYNVKAGTGGPSRDSIPGNVIYDLAADTVDITEYADHHLKKIRSALDIPTATSFSNRIAKFIRRDILAFNRMRVAILNMLDNWSRSVGALKSLDGKS